MLSRTLVSYPEMNFDGLRNMPAAERAERFKTYKTKMQVSDIKTSTQETRWHQIDADMTPARPGFAHTSQSQPVTQTSAVASHSTPNHKINQSGYGCRTCAEIT